MMVLAQNSRLSNRSKASWRLTPPVTTPGQTPLLIDLHRAAPSLDTFLRRLGPFSQASEPALRSLGDTSVVGKKALRDASDKITALRQLAKDRRTAVESGELMRYSELNVQLHATLREISRHTIAAQLLEQLRSVIEAFTAFADASAS